MEEDERKGGLEKLPRLPVRRIDPLADAVGMDDLLIINELIPAWETILSEGERQFLIRWLGLDRKKARTFPAIAREARLSNSSARDRAPRIIHHLRLHILRQRSEHSAGLAAPVDELVELLGTTPRARRAIRALKRGGIFSQSDLRSKLDQLEGMSGIGPKTSHAIRQALAELS